MVTTRPELIELIKAAFKGVSRQGGVSWSETDVIDDYGTDEERRLAREGDSDQDWFEVASIPRFSKDGGWGSFCFLDAIGFHYYLPAAMIQSLVLDQVYDCDVFDFSEVWRLLDGISSPSAFYHGGYLLLTDAQKSAIANYIAYNEAVGLSQTSTAAYDLIDSLDAKVRSDYLSVAVTELIHSDGEWPYG